ncbi:MAG: gliding motility-associated C-terminal domain-containing protein [Bacteroidia bacterium]
MKTQSVRSALQKGLVCLILILVNSLSAQSPCKSFKNGWPSTKKAFEIVSILVDACDGSNEGQNEMVRLITGPNPISISNFSVPTYITGRVNWNSTSNPWRGLTNWTTTTNAKISYLNKSIKNAGNCGLLIPLNSADKVPANAQLLIITSESWNELAQSFDGLNDTLYVAVQKSGNTAGHFANFGAAATRTFILRNGTASDTVIYHIDSLRKQNGTLGAEDGATVNFTFNGIATYTNYGCKIPVDPSSIDAGTVPVSGCATTSVQLNGKVINYPCFKWVAANPNAGKFSDTLSATPKFYPSTSGKITLYLKGYKACGGVAIDSVSFTIGSSTKANFDVDSSQAPLFCFTDKSSNASQLRWSFNSKNNIKTGSPKSFGQDTSYPKGDVCKDYFTLGSRYVCLIATNQNDSKCNDTLCKPIVIDLDAGTAKNKICAPDTFALKGKIRGITGYYWSVSDPMRGKINRIDTIKTFGQVFPNATSGRWVIYLIANSKHPLLRDSIVIDITAKAKAKFTVDSSAAPEFCFTNTSINAKKLKWSWYGKQGGFTNSDTTGDLQHFCKKYIGPGIDWACVIAETDLPQCNDTFCAKINHDFYIYLANVFTPGVQDGFNDEFRVPSAGLVNFELTIMNRWGELIFQTNTPNENWNGKVNNTGAECPAATYFYQLKYQFPAMPEKTVSGSIQLIR